MKKIRKFRLAPTVAPGMEDYLRKRATRAEIKRGDFTRVTRLSYDELL